jgi:hypothetical protein
MVFSLALGYTSGTEDLRLAFFMESSFVTRGASGADDPNHAAVLGMDHYKDAAAAGHANSNEPRLEAGVLLIRKRG